jgi:hypothetical protein
MGVFEIVAGNLLGFAGIFFGFKGYLETRKYIKENILIVNHNSKTKAIVKENWKQFIRENKFFDN